MEDVYSLIHCLTSREWESVQNYLSCFSTHSSDEGGLKQLQLARILREEPDCPTDTRSCLKVYGVKESKSFEKLRSRLKEKVLDFLLTDISCDKKQDLDEMDYAIIRMKKKSAQFHQLYYSKKRVPIMFRLLEEVISDAKTYEQYFILMEHLKAKQNLVCWKNGVQDFKKNVSEIETFSKINALYNRASHYCSELTMLNDYSGRQDGKKKLSWLKKVIAEIETGNRDIRSPHVDYSLKYLEIEYYQLQKDYTTALSKCLEWLNIVRNNKSVYRRQRVGIVYDNLSRCDYYLGKYEQAIEWAREAQQFFNLNSENYCIALEQEFYAAFALKEYGKATETAKKMLASATPKELGEFRHAKYNYLLASALFKLSRPEDALHILVQERGLSKDKSGWEIGLRVLAIMSLIETMKLNEASLAVGSLRKFIEYTTKSQPVSKRDRIIMELLVGAERKGFVFTQLNGKTDDLLIALMSSDEATRWEPFTQEVIPFHEWLAGKMGKRKNIIPAAGQHKPAKAAQAV